MPEVQAALAIPARRLAAVLFADIVGFTRLTAEDDAAAFRLAAILQECSRRNIPREGGRVVRFVGDSVLAEFPSAEAALHGAFALAKEFGRESTSLRSMPALLRIGVNVGELTEAADGDIYGEAVNLAARLQTEAQPSQVLVSDDVWRQLRGRGGFTFEAAGTRKLKGIAEAVKVHSVRDGSSPADALASGVAHVVAQSPDVQGGEPSPTRLIVLPFRSLRPDPDIDFLSFALADAVAATLSGLRSLVVRSSLVAQKYAGQTHDPRTIGQEAAVDLVLVGTMLRAGDRLRIVAQLTDAGSGELLWSESQQVSIGDIFQLQDDLAQRIAGSVATPLTKRERRLIRRDVPATARAYELYLRANEMSVQTDKLTIARDLYIAALEEDPEYAPAWARLGRCHRLIAKYSHGHANAGAEMQRAEAAFRKALELNPELTIAQHYYAQFEVENGRPREAMLRLIELVKMAPDAQLYAALVHALRYCGLLEESVAAHEAARRMDAKVATSVEYSYLFLERYEDAVRESSSRGLGGRVMSLLALGRTEEAIAGMEADRASYAQSGINIVGALSDSVQLALKGERQRAVEILVPTFDRFQDPEGHFLVGRWLAHVGAVDESLSLLQRTVGRYHAAYSLQHNSWFAPLREDARFQAILARVVEERERALTAFLEAGGPEVL